MTVSDRILGEAQTRAEKVRARRARQRRKMERLRVPDRGSKKRRRRRAPRRRFDLALPMELGAEIRLPALPRLKPGPRIASVLIVVLVGLSIRGILKAPAFYVVEASVQGHELLTEGQIRSIAQADEASIFLIDPAAAEARFESVAEIKQARVRVGWPDDVVVTVQERRPLVAWKDGYRDWWLSEEGVAFLKHGEREDLIHIESETPVLDIQGDPLAQVIDPQVLVAAGVLDAQLSGVENFQYDPVRGLGFEDPRGWTAYFGVEGDMVMKVRLYERLTSHLEEKGVAPELVSVKDPAAPFYRR